MYEQIKASEGISLVKFRYHPKGKRLFSNRFFPFIDTNEDTEPIRGQGKTGFEASVKGLNSGIMGKKIIV